MKKTKTFFICPTEGVVSENDHPMFKYDCTLTDDELLLTITNYGYLVNEPVTFSINESLLFVTDLILSNKSMLFGIHSKKDVDELLLSLDEALIQSYHELHIRYEEKTTNNKSVNHKSL